jgi:hypothetical protein
MAKKNKINSKKKMPLGIQLIAIWGYICAFFTFLVGLLMVLIQGPVLNFLESMKILPNPSIGSIISAALIVVGILMMVWGVFYYFLARGLWKGKNWARLVQLVFSALAVLGGLFSLPSGIVGLAINAAIIWYLGFNEEGKKYYSS